MNDAAEEAKENIALCYLKSSARVVQVFVNLRDRPGQSLYKSVCRGFAKPYLYAEALGDYRHEQTYFQWHLSFFGHKLLNHLAKYYKYNVTCITLNSLASVISVRLKLFVQPGGKRNL